MSDIIEWIWRRNLFEICNIISNLKLEILFKVNPCQVYISQRLSHSVIIITIAWLVYVLY
jgi:hypothetical protein